MILVAGNFLNSVSTYVRYVVIAKFHITIKLVFTYIHTGSFIKQF